MSEPSAEELQEQVALRLDKIAWRERDEELKCTICNTNAERAVFAIHCESHRVAGEKIKERAKAFEALYGRSPF